MNEVDGSNMKVYDPQYCEKIVFNETTAVPGEHKNTERYDDAEYLGQAVKKKIIIESRQAQQAQYENSIKNVYVAVLMQSL